MTTGHLGRRGRTARAAALVVALISAASCGRDSTGPTDGGGEVALEAGQYGIFAAGTLEFPAGGASGASYLVVAQSATGTSGLNTAFSLIGALGTAAAPPALVPAPAAVRAETPAALRFHDGLRLREAALVRAVRAAGTSLAVAPVRAAPAPPALGSQRTFKVCSDLDCSTLKTVVATARYVGAHAAIFTDDTMPSGGGFSAAAVQSMGVQFDQELYPIDRANFGAESDVDNNGVVLILLTPKVNALVGRPDCDDAFITGYFYGADIAPGYRTEYNNGEVFYGMVPDPEGTVSCAHSAAVARVLIQVTFVHEFQHMISFNQHVLVRGGDTEELWLNEGLSHLAEELVGSHYDSLGIDTTASRFYIGNLYNAYQYLADPLASAVVTDEPPGDLSERGAVWLFLRHVIDRAGAGTTQALVGTSLRGAANVEAAAGTPLDTLLGRWALAVYAGDLAGFTAPAELRYSHWRFRSVFSQLHVQAPADFPRAFPLIPVSATGGSVSVTGTVRSGSGVWVLVTQGANGAAFSLTFRPTGGGGFAENVRAQAAVVRLR